MRLWVIAKQDKQKIQEDKRRDFAITLCLRQHYLDQVFGYNLSSAQDLSSLCQHPFELLTTKVTLFPRSPRGKDVKSPPTPRGPAGGTPWCRRTDDGGLKEEPATYPTRGAELQGSWDQPPRPASLPHRGGGRRSLGL